MFTFYRILFCAILLNYIGFTDSFSQNITDSIPPNKDKKFSINFPVVPYSFDFSNSANNIMGFKTGLFFEYPLVKSIIALRSGFIFDTRKFNGTRNVRIDNCAWAVFPNGDSVLMCGNPATGWHVYSISRSFYEIEFHILDVSFNIISPRKKLYVSFSLENVLSKKLFIKENGMVADSVVDYMKIMDNSYYLKPKPGISVGYRVNEKFNMCLENYFGFSTSKYNDFLEKIKPHETFWLNDFSIRSILILSYHF